MKPKVAQFAAVAILLLIGALQWAQWHISQTRDKEWSPSINVCHVEDHNSHVSCATPARAECVKDESCYLCDIGAPPFDMDWILSELKIFREVFRKSPRQQNKYGTQIPHQFALWCFVRHFRPKQIIESGAHKG
eukprot:Selendium_serpulae@DN8206_c0_g1_i1.p1